MTTAEFNQARERLKLSHVDLAADYGLTPDMVVDYERGRAPVPKKVASELRWRVAILEQQELLQASGLPECPEALALERRAEETRGKEWVNAVEALQAHASACPVCGAREDYVRLHAPPLPERPLPLWLRAFGLAVRVEERLPEGIRPPPGDAGRGRRIGLFVAAAFSAIALTVLVISVGAQLLARGSLDPDGRTTALGLLLMPIAYFLGLYAAGLVFDLTRPLRRRLAGYLVRGAFGAAAAYGAVGLVMPLVDESVTWAELPRLVGLFAILGCLVGGGMWVSHRLGGKLKPQA
jgi:hypothetical protein